MIVCFLVLVEGGGFILGLCVARNINKHLNNYKRYHASIKQNSRVTFPFVLCFKGRMKVDRVSWMGGT